MRHPIDRLTPGMVINTGRGAASIVKKLPDRVDRKGRIVSRYSIEGNERKTFSGVSQRVDVYAAPAKCECTSIDYCAYCMERMSK